MKLSKYRIAAGHYAVGDLTVYGCYPRWQVRDGDELLEDFATLREAIRYAQFLRDLPRTRNVKPTPLPVDLGELRVMLAGPQS